MKRAFIAGWKFANGTTVYACPKDYPTLLSDTPVNFDSYSEALTAVKTIAVHGDYKPFVSEVEEEEVDG